MAEVRPDAWIEVDRGALIHNYHLVAERAGQGVDVMAVVKGNGYGHGTVGAAMAFEAAGARWIGVSRLSEAAALRAAGVRARILVLTPIERANATAAAELAVDCTVTCAEDVAALTAHGLSGSAPLAVHVKVDVGMGRLGVLPPECGAVVGALSGASGLLLDGVYAHLPKAAEGDVPACRRQLEAFERVVRDVQTADAAPVRAHVLNSAGLMLFPEGRHTMVRVGTLLYGQSPWPKATRLPDLRRTWALRARVLQVRQLPKGATVGYGSEWTARRPTRTAVLPLGFGDGFTLAPIGPIMRRSALRFAMDRWRRSLHVFFGDRPAQVLGRVAMNMVVVDVTDLPEVGAGAVAEVPCLRVPTSALLPRVYLG
ncbi:MAG: alanine racemase [Armatimonadetes bacterium]|nr:alanine racemase [Armatimonadota bacterium]